MTDSFKCFDCQYKEQQQRCLTDGKLDVAKIAGTWLIHSRSDNTVAKDFAWAWDCFYERVSDDAENAYIILLECVALAETVEDASIIAAGPLEDLINKHGQQFIDRIENLARKSLRFRFVVSGVWPSKEHPEVHLRITELQSTGPHMDKGDPLPLE